MKKVLSGDLRREKIEQLNQSSAAVNIQAAWRSKSTRKQLEATSKCDKTVSDNVKQPVDLVGRGDQCDEEINAIKEDENYEPICALERKLSIGMDIDDDADDAPVDPEEQHLETEAIAEETIAIKSKNSFILSQAPIDGWPAPIKENFDETWPNLSDSKHHVPDWIVNNECLLIRSVTWNLCGKKPPPDSAVVERLLPKDKFHIYLIGTEECERTIAQSAIIVSKKSWEQYLTQCLGENYVAIRAHTLQAIHLIAFVHRKVVPFISHVVSAAIPTGMGDTLGNKGGCGIYFKIAGTSILVVNAHLAAHQNAVKRRNEDFRKIDAQLPVKLALKLKELHHKHYLAHGDKSKEESIFQVPKKDVETPNDTLPNNYSEAEQPLMPSNLASFADRVIFMGDLNYRIRGNRSAVDALLRKSMHEVMINNDQLNWSRKNGHIPIGFSEPLLHFKPTYKFDIDSDVYDSGRKKRVPAWTDRILFVERGMTCLGYDADFALRSSDHRPVYASFHCSVDSKQMKEMISHIHSPTKAKATGDSEPQFSSESQVCAVM